MTILEQVVVPAQTANQTNRRPFNGVAFNPQDRPRAKVWGNFGIMNGEEFIPLPLGAAIDTMEPASVTGQNIAVVKLNHGKNTVLAALQAIGADMKPGETKFIPNIVFQLRRVQEDLELVKNENDVDLSGVLALLAPKKAAETPAIQPDKAAMQAQLEALQKALAE